MDRVTRIQSAVLLSAATILLAARPLAAQEDDLAVVKRAVMVSPVGKEVHETLSPSDTRAVKAHWLKVRVTPKGGRRGKVSINLPLSLVRALGDIPVDFRCNGKRSRYHDERCGLRVSEILRALEEGKESLVEIDDDDASVRIWIE